MKIIIDGYVGDAYGKLNKDGKVEIKNSTSMNNKFWVNWLTQTKRGNDPNNYKRNLIFHGTFASGKLIGCFPILINPDEFVINFDAMQYE